MEVIKEPSSDLHVVEISKPVLAENEDAAVAVAANLCQNSNGVDEIGKAGQSEATVTGTGNEASKTPETELPQDSADLSETTSDTLGDEQDSCSNLNTSKNINNVATVEEAPSDKVPTDTNINTLEVDEVVTEVIIEDDTEKAVSHDSGVVEVSNSEASSDNIPKFRTEVVIEANDISSNDEGHETSNNILSEFGESIELSEVLRSSDVTETSENNNSTVRQEVFNKEELLDILQGNDVEATPPASVTEVKSTLRQTQDFETKLALEQLSRLKREHKKVKRPLRMTKAKRDKKFGIENETVCNIENTDAVEKKETDQISEESVKKEIVTINKDESTKELKDTEKKTTKVPTHSESIVDVLVLDWDDDEQVTTKSEEPKESLIVDSEKLLKETETLKTNQEIIAKEDKPLEHVTQDKATKRMSVDSVPSEDQIQREKTQEENQPQRRLGRVIKKKVIFDPDNPDTFTKTKTKTRETVKDSAAKEQPPIKKGKQEQPQMRSKSKSPMPNSQWKKPSSKNSKQNRRLTEVDKLLMDEGAVNMIYQLTPEAPKGKKSRETKAEFIKKIQSSTPDSKEMKFRERKILKYEDGEAKKILGLKHRVSLNSSMKSPSVSEDFETHSADDSIIYRRHSSSSYSSSCMSPRRLSDVDTTLTQTNSRVSQVSSDNQNANSEQDKPEQETDVFMSNIDNSVAEVINKDDYLSIKEKLNSKLSLALNKRKRENIKNEKPSKQKKVAKSEEKNESESKGLLGDLKHITIIIDQRLAEISIGRTGLQYNVEVLKEIEQALTFVNSLKETSVTLLTECCTVSSNLDLKHLVDEDMSKRMNNALEVTKTIRSLLLTLDKHSKLVCSGVGAECRGVGLALAALSDVVLASERASFALAAKYVSQPAAASLTARCRLPRSMVDDLIVFGRKLSATEALRGGLVSRVLWPDRFHEQVYNIAKDIALEPVQSVILKKQLLNLKKMGENDQTFQACLEAEGEFFVQYWTSVEGQELLRTDTT